MEIGSDDGGLGRQVYSRGDPGYEGEGFVEESGEFTLGNLGG